MVFIIFMSVRQCGISGVKFNKYSSVAWVNIIRIKEGSEFGMGNCHKTILCKVQTFLKIAIFIFKGPSEQRVLNVLLLSCYLLYSTFLYQVISSNKIVYSFRHFIPQKQFHIKKVNIIANGSGKILVKIRKVYNKVMYLEIYYLLKILTI